MRTVELNVGPGEHIQRACQEAVQKSQLKNCAVHFTFNGTEVTVQPGENVEDVEARWEADRKAAHEKWMASPERAQQEAQRAEELRRNMAATMKETAKTEADLRGATVPWPYTKEQLMEYIDSLVEREHEYGTCVYAMSMAAVAAYYYVSRKLGVTGFQASCADLDFIRRTRNLKGPFMLIKAEDALFPQCDPIAKLEEAIREWQPWLKEQAQKNLSEKDHAHPNVVAHWERLAK